MSTRKADGAFGDHSRILFIGDSITDAGRTEGRGQVGGGYLGDGYVWALHGLLRATWPERELVITNAGVGGSTAGQMRERLPADLAKGGPYSWVSMLIGINDCNGYLQDGRPEIAPDAYEANLRDAVQLIEEAGAGLIMMDPFLIATPTTVRSEWKPNLDLVKEYAAASARVAGEAGALRVRTQEEFDRQLAFRTPAELGLEEVHPSPTGHLVLAQAWLTEMGR